MTASRGQDSDTVRALDSAEGNVVQAVGSTVRANSQLSDWEPPDLNDVAGMLPQFSFEKFLGRGGMGAVYLAHQLGLERKVAIKLLPAILAEDQQFVEWFRREARVLAQLSHPGIVTIHDFGQTQEGNYYVVMEYVEGANLHQIIRGDGLEPRQALDLVVQICEALEYAHSQGVIHRDIKPANVLVSRSGQAKLADFGLAKFIQKQEGAEPALTRTNQVMGTPDYMAPEQREGRAADERADIYSLGVLFYEMLTGERPQVILDKLSSRVNLDSRLDKVVAKALQQQPERRYQQVSTMKGDLNRIRKTAVSRHRTLLWVVAFSLPLLLLATAGIMFWYSPVPVPSSSETQPPPPAPGPERQAEPMPEDRPTTLAYAPEEAGSGWTVVPPITDTDLHCVWGWDPRNVWAVGQKGTILHFDGSSWKKMDSGTLEDLFAVVGTQDGTCVWAAGDHGTILRFRAGQWETMASGTTERLLAIVCCCPNHAWAAGENGSLCRWENMKWSTRSSGTTRTLRSLFGVKVNNIWAAGDHGFVMHWDGRRWQAEDSGTQMDIHHVCEMDPTGVVASGREGTMMFREAPNRWKPYRNSPYFGPDGARFTFLGFSGSDSLAWSITDRSWMLKGDEFDWLAVRLPVQSRLNSLWGHRDLFQCAVGQKGAIIVRGKSDLDVPERSLGMSGDPSPRSATDPSWKDLLKNVDPANHSLTGAWRLGPEGLFIVQPTFLGTCELPFEGALPAEYDLRVCVTRHTREESIQIAFRKGDRGAAFVLDAPLPSQSLMLAGLEHVQGLGLFEKNPTRLTRPRWLLSGVPHEIILRVRNSGLSVDVDGSQIFQWRGDWNTCSQTGGWFPSKVGIRPIFAVGSSRSEAVFHVVEMKALP
ncbi:serine/threonine-protein kinase [Roseimicrobium gellanilyticum]|uniref:serine/threonine-protein kinase n=1 Tax=Roseimicrobium gellanilyticum TaxID=748857 RepID=UPI00147680C6|nr:serine/threonine-protein kinase [Roseimicrobium gellanilyticum]